MSRHYAWSVSDIQSSDTDAPYAPPIRPFGNGTNHMGRPKHPVSAGQHDDALVQMDADGHPIENIANTFGCSVAIAERRLKMLQREAAQQ